MRLNVQVTPSCLKAEGWRGMGRGGKGEKSAKTVSRSTCNDVHPCCEGTPP